MWAESVENNGPRPEGIGGGTGAGDGAGVLFDLPIPPISFRAKVTPFRLPKRPKPPPSTGVVVVVVVK